MRRDERGGVKVAEMVVVGHGCCYSGRDLVRLVEMWLGFLVLF
jgi:hypothetical protein